MTHGPLNRYVKLWVAHAPGNQRKPLVSNSSMHHGTCVTHVTWCMSGSLTLANPRWRRKLIWKRVPWSSLQYIANTQLVPPQSIKEFDKVSTRKEEEMHNEQLHITYLYFVPLFLLECNAWERYCDMEDRCPIWLYRCLSARLRYVHC